MVEVSIGAVGGIFGLMGLVMEYALFRKYVHENDYKDVKKTSEEWYISAALLMLASTMLGVDFLITADLNSIKLGSIMMVFGMIALIMGYKYGNRAKELRLQETIAKGIEIGMKKAKEG